MPKQQTCQIFIYKINSQRLAEAKWNLTLPLEEARRNEEIVPLASSQQLRWIDALNNMVNQEAKAKAVKRRIKDLRHEENSTENRREIRQLYQQLDKIQFKPDYVTVVIHNKRDYRRARKGFYINGVRYERLLGTTGGVKNNTIVFVSSRLVNELRKRINNGRNPDQEFIPAKLEAYRALTCSASIPVTEPDGILVVNDCLTHFKDDVILIDDSNDGEPEMTHIKDYDCELNASDGFGLMSYELAQQWSEDLQLEKTMSGCCIRNAFCKGMVFPFPFREFAKKVAKKNMVLDAWGTWRDIHRVQLVLTTSMLKLWDSYDSLEDYIENCHENGYTFAVTKTCELELENEHNLNYQFIQSYRLIDEQIRELIKPTVDEFKAVLGGNWEDAVLFLRGPRMKAEPGYIKGLADDYVKALMIEPELIHDRYVQEHIYRMLRKKIDRAKTGVLKVHGNFQVLSGDPYALCQSMFGLEVTGLLTAGQFYSKYWIDCGVDKVVCYRAPMSCHNNIRVMAVNKSDECQYWYRYMKTVSILNAWDNTCAALNGADFDGDLMFSTDNRVLLENTRATPPILCIQKKGEKKVPTEDDFIESNMNGFGDSIGKITNRITTMFDVQSRFEVGSREFETLEYRICCGQLFQQNSIDRIKGVKSKPMPKSWYDYSACKIEDGDDPDTIADKQFNMRILANKKPYFMSYIYPEQIRGYKKYMNAIRRKTVREMSDDAQDILAKSEEERTEYENTFIQYYLFKNPVGMNLCTMNRICWMIEEEMDGYLKHLRHDDVLDYDAIKSGKEYSLSTYYATRKVFLEAVDCAKRKQKELATSKVSTNSDYDYSRHYAMYLDELRRELLEKCSDDDMLYDILIDVCKRSNASRELIWKLFGDKIVNYLLNKHGNKIYVIAKDPAGDVTYCGDRYRTIAVDMNEAVHNETGDE